MSWLDKYFLYNRTVQDGGTSLPGRPALNFKGSGVSVVDNPTTETTEVTITGGGGGGQTYELAATSAALVAGDVVCLVQSSGSATRITKAVPAALIAAGVALGIVDQAYTPGDTDVVVLETGTVDALVTGLGTAVDGVAHDVGVSASARCQYLYNPSGAEFIVGNAAPNGRLSVKPRAANVTAPSHIFNPLTFGAAGDGVTDDLPAFEAMRDFMVALAVQEGVGGTTAIYEIELPAGRVFYLSDTCIIASACKISQRGGGQFNTAGRIVSAPGKSALWFENGVYDTAIGGDSSCSDVGFLTCWSQPLVRYRASGWGVSFGIGPTLRTTVTPFVKGNCIVAGTSFGANTNSSVFFRATTTGSTGSTAYASLFDQATGTRTLSTALVGDVFVDGGVTWLCEGFVFPRGIARGGGSKTTYAVGERYMNFGANRVPLAGVGNDEDAQAGEDDNRFYYECAIAGTINATPANVHGPDGPSLTQPIRTNGQTYNEGDIVTGGTDGFTIDPVNNKRYQAQGAGTAGGGAPTYNNTPGATFTDGTVTLKTLDVPTNGNTGLFPRYFTDGSSAAGAVFEMKVHAGIIATGSFTRVHDCYARGFTNAAVHGEGVTPTSFDNGKVLNLITSSNGLGVYIGTSEANGCRIRGIDSLKSGDTLQNLETVDGSSGTVNRGGASLWDHAQGGCSAADVYGQNSEGRNIFGHSVSATSVYNACSSENSRGDRAIAGGIIIGGSQGTASGAPAFGPWTIIGPIGGNGYGLDLFDNVSKTRLQLQPKSSGSLAHTVLNLRNTDTAVESGSEGFRFGYEDLFLGTDTGYWNWPGYGTQNPMCVGGFTGAQADAGPGHGWVEHGVVLGRIGIAKGFWGLVTDSSQTTKTSKQVFEGTRKAGFKFEYWNRGVAGTWRHELVAADAYDAPARTNGMTAFVAGSPEGWAATTIKSPNGLYVYKATVGGTAAGSAPAGLDAGSSPVTDGSITWTLLGAAATYNVGGFIDDPQKALTPQRDGEWKDTAGTSAAATCPKEYVLYRRRQFSTSSASANQVVFNEPTLPDGAVSSVKVEIHGIANGSAVAFQNEIKGVARRTGGGAVMVAASTSGTAVEEGALVGTTADLVANSNGIDVRISPATASQVDWGIEVSISVRER